MTQDELTRLIDTLMRRALLVFALSNGSMIPEPLRYEFSEMLDKLRIEVTDLISSALKDHVK